MSFQPILRSTALFGSIRWARAYGKWHAIGAGSGASQSSISPSPLSPPSTSSGARLNMTHARLKHVIIGLMLVVMVAGSYFLWRPGDAVPIIGVVRTTEIRIAPEVGGQLGAIKVKKGDHVRTGDVVAELSALELTAAVAQARAALAAAKADRDHVYAGVREEEIASLAATIAKAKSRLEYAGLQYARAAYLARSYAASQQSLDQAEND